MLLLVIAALQVAGKIASCNMAFRFVNRFRPMRSRPSSTELTRPTQNRIIRHIIYVLLQGTARTHVFPVAFEQLYFIFQCYVILRCGFRENRESNSQLNSQYLNSLYLQKTDRKYLPYI